MNKAREDPFYYKKSLPGSRAEVIEPIGEQAELIHCNVALSNPVEQVPQQRGWQVGPKDFRHSVFRRRNRG